MWLFTLAIAPGLAICIYFFYRDTNNKEPAWNLIFSFILGMLSTVPAIVLELSTQGFGNKTIAGIILSTFLFVALIEEFCKFLALRYYAFTRKSFDEPLDGIVYSVMVSMGFATVENIGYVLDPSNGWSVGIVRMFTSVPAHATFAVIMGYYTGNAKFDFLHRKSLLLKGFLGAVLAHGTYDSFLFLNANPSIKQYIPSPLAALLLFAGAVFSLFICIRFGRKLFRLQLATSRQLYHMSPVLTIRHASHDDIDLIRTLALQIWPQSYSRILTHPQIHYMMDQMYSAQALKKQMDENHHFIIVYNAGIPVGFASYSEKEAAVYKLHKLYILPNQQGRGTGKFLLEQIMNDIKPKGAVSIILNVNRNNPARGFYEKLGFTVLRSEDIDIGRGYFMNDYIMEKKLLQT